MIVHYACLVLFRIYSLYDSTFWHCATNRKAACSIPEGVIGIFHLTNPSGRTMALGLTQPLTEMSTRNISLGVKAADAQGWQPYHLRVPIVLKYGSLNFLEPSGPVQACNGIALPLLCTNLHASWNPLGQSRSVMGLLYLMIQPYILHLMLV